MSGQTLKRCSSPLHVGERDLPLDAFHRCASKKDGRKAHCRACVATEHRADPSKQKARGRKHYEIHGERIRERRKALHASDPEYGRRKAREWALANPERVRRNYRRWVEANRDHVNAYSRSHIRQNRAYYRAALIRYRARKKGNGGHCTPEQLAARWSYYAGRCWMCGAEATEWDHVKPVSKGGCSWPANLRPACGPCNRRKSGIWPL